MTQDQETGKFMAVGLDNDAAPVAGEDPAMSRILRRETHSSRAGAAVSAAALGIILCV